MSALSDYLKYCNMHTPPGAYFQGVLNVISGPPDGNTSPYFAFTHDETNDKLYVNTDRTPTSWIEIADATAVGSPLTANT